MAESTYSIEGLQTGPWLTLSHPVGSDRTTWAAQVAVLARQYRVLSYDIRGHGHAPSQGSVCSVDDLAADVHRLWQQLGIERSHFVGLSLGGCVGLALAHRHPETVQSLVIANARLEMDTAATQMWLQRAATVEQHGMAPVVEPTLERWLTPAFKALQPTQVAAVRRSLAATSPEGFAACARALADMHQAHRLLDLKIPTLLLAGLSDLAVPRDLMQGYAASNARLQFVELSGPHIVHLENPDGFSRAVLDFLAPR
ncbi:alpha/beta fold hydrolase [Polaromonas eurypsychrophila]|uniref:3-oxoadipate enol-lactonase n=1 Tax=Polaromonas eurypsychrophila TaxID=1614635 RepID=A0A916SGB4_9BURK|nr:alpha/beta fold hydrolase [Polaromonas eurypsychrophila]GGA97747.1 3-oxoadipate enol-lactonase [Polaromonas eurypsychrophila]